MSTNTKLTIFTFFKRAAFLFSVAFLIFSCNSNDDDTFDCESLEANFGDTCDSAGVVSLDCQCVYSYGDDGLIDSTWTDTTVVSTYDCPELMQNISDSCWVTVQGMNLIGVVTADCECYAEAAPSFDCPELMLNFGDSCWVINSDSTFVEGIIDLDCNCN